MHLTLFFDAARTPVSSGAKTPLFCPAAGRACMAPEKPVDRQRTAESPLPILLSCYTFCPTDVPPTSMRPKGSNARPWRTGARGQPTPGRVQWRASPSRLRGSRSLPRRCMNEGGGCDREFVGVLCVRSVHNNFVVQRHLVSLASDGYAIRSRTNCGIG